MDREERVLLLRGYAALFIVCGGAALGLRWVDLPLWPVPLMLLSIASFWAVVGLVFWGIGFVFKGTR